MVDEVRITVRIPRELAKGVEKVQEARGLTPSIILRNALTLYLATIDGSTETERRRQFSSEYLFLGIDLL
ncbi:ribbon-helix-helix protein, CopG family, partial [Herbaspirillum sp. HC18]